MRSNMSSLAKQILRNKKNPHNADELGLPTENSKGDKLRHNPQYLVARALLLESKDPSYDPDTTHRLHLRDGRIYLRNVAVDETDREFYRLTGVSYSVPVQIRMLFWGELKRRIPKLNPNFYKISDRLWWDKKKGEIIEGDYDEILEKIN